VPCRLGDFAPFGHGTGPESRRAASHVSPVHRDVQGHRCAGSARLDVASVV